MIIEVGKTYINRAGSLCKVLSRTDPSVSNGFVAYYSYFPLENGREVREQAFHVDKYGSYIWVSNSLVDNLGIDHDLVEEYKIPELQWAWCQPNKNGLWAYGGDRDKTPPLLSGIDIVWDYAPTRARINCWRCYVGPIPQISQPKKLVKQTLWLVKYHADLIWKEIWLPDEEVPKTISYQDVVHKTCTTRTV